MRLFLGSSVMIAGATSAEGASRSVFRLPGTHDWLLLATPYAVGETVRNLAAFPASVTASWLRLRSRLVVVDDALTIDKPAVFPVEKDRPVLFGPLASADVLPTLDRADFSRLLGGGFYGLAIMTPGMWLLREREAGRWGRV